jgi:hypothetical protein
MVLQRAADAPFPLARGCDPVAGSVGTGSDKHSPQRGSSEKEHGDVEDKAGRHVTFCTQRRRNKAPARGDPGHSRLAIERFEVPGLGHEYGMRPDQQRVRLRERRVFLEDLSAGRALRERVYPRRGHRSRARQHFLLTTYTR